MKTTRALLVACVLALLASAGIYADDQWYGSGGGGGAATITGGTCTDPTKAVTALSTAGLPTCGAIGQSSVTGLGTSLADLASQIGTANQPGTQGTYLQAGCSVVWSGSGYVYNVSACTYLIQGTQYTSPAATLTLTASDATNDRFDTIVVNTSSVAAKIDGTAAANPAVPTIDPTTQLILTHVLVTHNTSAPVGASNETVYANNSEWTSTTGTGWSCDDTGNNHTGSGTKDCKATAVSSGASTKFVRSSTLTLNAYQQLFMWVAPVSWGNSRTLQVTIRDANEVQLGNVVTIQNGSYGFDRTSTSYQLIGIPLSAFSVPANAAVKQIRLNPQGSGGTFTFYVDDINLQTTTNTTVPGAAYATAYRGPDGQIATTGPGTATYLLTSNGASSPPTYQVAATPTPLNTIWWIPVASCQNTTAALLWDTPVSNPAVAACKTGTNTQLGTADFADGANSLSIQMTLKLPSNYNSGGTTSAKLKWISATTSGDVVWQVATICVADAETDDPSFNTASTVTETTKGTTLQTNDASISPLTMTGCAADELLHLKVFRDPANGSDTMAGTARLIGVELTVPRS